MKNNKFISLDDQPVKHPFKVPKNYFESLPMEIQGKLSQPQLDFSLYKKVAVGAASLATLVIILFTLFKSDHITITSSDQLLSSVSEASLIAYLDNTHLDEEDLINEFDATYTLSNNVLSNTIEQETLKNYEDAYSTEDELELYDYE